MAERAVEIAKGQLSDPDEWEIRSGSEDAYGRSAQFWDLVHTSGGVVRLHDDGVTYWASSAVKEGDLVCQLDYGTSSSVLASILRALGDHDYSETKRGVRIETAGQKFDFELFLRS